MAKTSKNSQERETLENILRLEPLRNKLKGQDLQKLDMVLENLQKNVGSTVSKSNAAEIFKVSRQTVDHWIKEGLMPVRRRANGREGIPREAFQRVAGEVNQLKDMGQTRSFLSEALHAVADDIAPKRKAKSKVKATTKPKAKAATKPKRKSTAKPKGKATSKAKIKGASKASGKK